MAATCHNKTTHHCRILLTGYQRRITLLRLGSALDRQVLMRRIDSCEFLLRSEKRY